MTRAEWITLAATAAALGASALLFVRARRAARGGCDPVGPPSSVQPMRDLLASTTMRRRRISPSAPVTDLRSDVEADHDAREAEVDAAHMAQQLADIRDACGAEEAVLWTWDEGRDALKPASWSTPHAARPAHFQIEEWGPLARWVAQGRIVVCDEDDGATAPMFAGAPVVDETLLVGVLTVTHAGGLGLSRQRAKEWLPRYADQVQRLVSLSEVRREYARQMRQSRALLSAMHKIQHAATADAIGAALIETALEVSSASVVALVRWRADIQKGAVRYGTPGFRQPPPYALDRDTLVSDALCNTMPLFVEDATQLDRRTSLFTTGDGGWPVGSLAIIPLIRDDRAMGAIVVASPELARITHDEYQNLSVLGAMSAQPLQLVWEIDEVTKRASTDGLTGLTNRRAFDEQLKRLLNETDRFGQPLALIVADIDHFKRINDTWGHEAGDDVLRWVARKLTEGVRNVDVCARYGGEEFAVLLPQTSLAGAADLADRLRHAVEARPVKFKGEEISVTISLGVASYPEAVTARENLFRAADKALYDAKKAGRNCVRTIGISQGAGGA